MVVVNPRAKAIARQISQSGGIGGGGRGPTVVKTERGTFVSTTSPEGQKIQQKAARTAGEIIREARQKGLTLEQTRQLALRDPQARRVERQIQRERTVIVRQRSIPTIKTQTVLGPVRSRPTTDKTTKILRQIVLGRTFEKVPTIQFTLTLPSGNTKEITVPERVVRTQSFKNIQSYVAARSAAEAAKEAGTSKVLARRQKRVMREKRLTQAEQNFINALGLQGAERTPDGKFKDQSGNVYQQVGRSTVEILKATGRGLIQIPGLPSILFGKGAEQAANLVDRETRPQTKAALMKNPVVRFISAGPGPSFKKSEASREIGSKGKVFIKAFDPRQPEGVANIIITTALFGAGIMRVFRNPKTATAKFNSALSKSKVVSAKTKVKKVGPNKFKHTQKGIVSIQGKKFPFKKTGFTKKKMPIDNLAKDSLARFRIRVKEGGKIANGIETVIKSKLAIKKAGGNVKKAIKETKLKTELKITRVRAKVAEKVIVPPRTILRKYYGITTENFNKLAIPLQNKIIVQAARIKINLQTKGRAFTKASQLAIETKKTRIQARIARVTTVPIKITKKNIIKVRKKVKVSTIDPIKDYYGISVKRFKRLKRRTKFLMFNNINKVLNKLIKERVKNYIIIKKIRIGKNVEIRVTNKIQDSITPKEIIRGRINLRLDRVGKRIGRELKDSERKVISNSFSKSVDNFNKFLTSIERSTKGVRITKSLRLLKELRNQIRIRVGSIRNEIKAIKNHRDLFSKKEFEQALKKNRKALARAKASALILAKKLKEARIKFKGEKVRLPKTKVLPFAKVLRSGKQRSNALSVLEKQAKVPSVKKEVKRVRSVEKDLERVPRTRGSQQLAPLLQKVEAKTKSNIVSGSVVKQKLRSEFKSLEKKKVEAKTKTQLESVTKKQNVVKGSFRSMVRLAVVSSAQLDFVRRQVFVSRVGLKPALKVGAKIATKPVTKPVSVPSLVPATLVIPAIAVTPLFAQLFMSNIISLSTGVTNLIHKKPKGLFGGGGDIIPGDFSKRFLAGKDISFIFVSDLAARIRGEKATPAERKRLLRVGRIFSGTEARKIVG